MVGGVVGNQLQGRAGFVRRWGSMGGGAPSLVCEQAMHARVDDDKFLACESESRQCWAGEAWATRLMSAVGREHASEHWIAGPWHCGLGVAKQAVRITARAPVPPATLTVLTVR